MRKFFPASFYNPTTLVGAVIVAVSAVNILFLFLLETFAVHQKPYMGIVAFVILPGFLILGLLLVGGGIIREHLRDQPKEPSEQRMPTIDLNNPQQLMAFIVFCLGTLLLLMFTAFGSYKAYEYTESVSFCGELCHKVMEPEYTAYKFSPHARVACVECHIGSGADWFVRSKISGSYQAYATVFKTYPRPIPTPVKNLRPAQETCEQCHWPEHFFSEKLKVGSYFLSDERNIRWTLSMLMKIGGGNIEAGPTSGIHWHMNIANTVTYVAVDPMRLVIPWVRTRGIDGREKIYRSSEIAISDKDLKDTPKRVMDCIDCHNRPSHIYNPPARSINHLMTLGWIDPQLPNIKGIGVKALENKYNSRQEGLDGIRLTIEEFYRKSYPAIAISMKAEIQRAIMELQKTYSRNYFPYMKVSWKKFPDHIGHLYSPGCFRCHDGKHVSDDGKVLSKDCNLCHVILAQEFEKNKMRISLSGLEFRHPGEVGDAWKEMNCSECHGGH